MNRCGTWLGYLDHMQVGDGLCDLCRQAGAEYQSYRRFRRGEQSDPWRCRGCGSAFRYHICHLRAKVSR